MRLALIAWTKNQEIDHKNPATLPADIQPLLCASGLTQFFPGSNISEEIYAQATEFQNVNSLTLPIAEAHVKPCHAVDWPHLGKSQKVSSR